MSEVQLYELTYYIAATVMFALGMKFNFYYITGNKGICKCLSTIVKWYKSYELTTEINGRIDNFKLISNGCNIIIWSGVILIIGLTIYTQCFLPLPYTSKYYIN